MLLTLLAAVTGSTGATDITNVIAAPAPASSGGPNEYTLWAAGITVLGLVIVAGVTAYTTNKRLSKQLKNDQELHSQKLSNDLARQRDQLAHDRDLKQQDLEHDRRIKDTMDLREFLDQACQIFEGATDSLIDYLSALETEHEYYARVDEETQERLRETVRSRLLPAADGLAASQAMLRRMDIRLPPDHPVRESYSAVVNDLSDGFQLLRQADPFTEDVGQQGKQKLLDSMRDWAHFAIAAQVAIGARIDDGSGDTEVDVDAMREIIAARMAEAKGPLPEDNLATEAD